MGDFIAFSHWLLHTFFKIIHFDYLWRKVFFTWWYWWFWNFIRNWFVTLWLTFSKIEYIWLKNSPVWARTFDVININFSLFHKSSNVWSCQNAPIKRRRLIWFFEIRWGRCELFSSPRRCLYFNLFMGISLWWFNLNF